MFSLSFLKDFICLLLEREKGGRKRGRENISVWEISVASHTAPNWGPGLQLRHVPWLGIEPATFQFTGSAQSTEPHLARAVLFYFNWPFSQAAWKKISLLVLASELLQTALIITQNEQEIQDTEKRIHGALGNLTVYQFPIHLPNGLN